MIDYEEIAREAGMHPDKLYAPLAKAHGYIVLFYFKGFYWTDTIRASVEDYATELEAWKAACLENNLI